MRKRQSGFTLVEVLMASILACITLTCIIQFFLTQLHQYRLINSNNKLNENLRILSKFLEKDVHNSLSFYVFNNLEEIISPENGNFTLPTAPCIGNCVLFVQERGMVEGGRGVIYHIGEKITLNGQDCYPLYRALVTFSKEKKIIESADTLANLTVGYLPKLNSETAESGNETITNEWPQFFSGTNSETGIFYTNNRRYAKDSDYNPYVAGCRRGLFVKTRLIQPGFNDINAETLCNFCFFSRNPRFY